MMFTVPTQVSAKTYRENKERLGKLSGHPVLGENSRYKRESYPLGKILM